MGHFNPRDAARSVWAPVARRIDVRLDNLSAAINARFDRSDAELLRLREDVAALRAAMWRSKAVAVGDRILVGCKHVDLVFFVEADDHLIGPRFIVDGEYEPSTTAFVKRTVREDSMCIDVGANFGYYACMMGQLAWKGRVLAFEADPLIHRLLSDNVTINWCEGIVEPINVAVGAENGTLQMHRWFHKSGNTSITRPWSGADGLSDPGQSEPFTVDAIALDSLVEKLGRVDLIKIDVEGAESLVIAGMGELMKRFRPTVIIEWSPVQFERAGFLRSDIADSLRSWGMNLHVLLPDGSLTQIQFEELHTLSFQNLVLADAPSS